MSPALDHFLAALRANGIQPRKSGRGWSCRCPAHEDQHPSLSIGKGQDGRVLVRCHAGCAPESIVAAVGREMRDLMPAAPVAAARRNAASAPRAKAPPHAPQKPPPLYESADAAVAERERLRGRKADHRFPYHDKDGQVVGEVLRWNKPSGKRSAILPIARGGTGWTLEGMPAPRPLYRLPQLLATPPGARAFVVEGELKCERLAALGVVATTSAHGAGSAKFSDWSPLASKEVVLLADHDEDGEKYATEVAVLAHKAVADSVRIVRFPELPAGGDVADFIAMRRAQGRTDEEVAQEIQTMADQTPLVEPAKGSAANAFTAKSLGELLRGYPNLRPPIIEGLLRQGETLNLIAPPKAGKSWLVLGLAISIATGKPFLGEFNTVRGNVLILDNELHRETLANRIPKVAAAMGVALEDIADAIYVESFRGNLRDIEQLENYFAGVEPGRFAVVILDAFYRCLPAGTDENDNGAMAAIYNLIDQYAERLGASFVLIHHASKGNQSSKSVTDVGAGAGAQSRSADNHVVLRAHEENNVVVLEAVVRSWPPVEPICLRREFPIWVREESLDPSKLRRDRQRSASAKDNKTPAKEAPHAWTVEEFAEKFTKDEPSSRDAILLEAESAGLSKSKAKALLNVAVEKGSAFEWRTNGSQRVRISRVEQPVTATAPRARAGGSARARPPTPPRNRKSGPGKGKALSARSNHQKPKPKGQGGKP